MGDIWGANTLSTSIFPPPTPLAVINPVLNGPTRLNRHYAPNTSLFFDTFKPTGQRMNGRLSASSYTHCKRRRQTGVALCGSMRTPQNSWMSKRNNWKLIGPTHPRFCAAACIDQSWMGSNGRQHTLLNHKLLDRTSGADFLFCWTRIYIF